MKKFYSFALTIFFLLILAVPVLWVVKGNEPQEVSVVEARNLAAIEPASTPNLQRALNLITNKKYFDAAKIMIDLYTNASFINNFERVVSDQFPYRMSIIEFSKALDRRIIKFVYSFTDDPVYPADMTSNIYYDSINDQLLDPITPFNANTMENINLRIENYENLLNLNPDKNFYLYYHQNIEDSEFHPLTPYFPDADKGQSIKYFENLLPQRINFEKFLDYGKNISGTFP